jgi:enoyl-CoA hydratase
LLRSELREDGVAIFTLADPDKRNVIGPQLAAELSDAVDAVARDPNARALIVAADGPAFCAGADLPRIFGQERPNAEMRVALHAYYESFLRIRALAIPTFAAVDGPAIGAGLNLALSCDVRVASPRAQFGATFARIGLHPGGGCTAFLVEALGRQRALRILLGAETLDGPTAFDTGLVAVLDENPRASAIALAARAAELEPWLAQSIVRCVEIAERDGFDAALEFETWAQAESTHSRRFRAHVARFVR